MKLKRILVLALALMVVAMPIGFAEAGYGALTLSNFHVDLSGMDQPLDVDAALTIGVGGQEDGSGRIDASLTGGGQAAFSASANFDKDKVQAIVGGSNYYFEIPMKELQKAMANAESGAAGSVKPEDYQKMQDLANRYMAILKKYSDPAIAAKISQKVLPSLNLADKGKESIDLFGQSMELNRYDVTMTGGDIGKLYQALFDADPEIKALMDDYFTMIGDLSGEKIPFTADSLGTSFSDTLKKQNVDLKMDLSVWSDTQPTDETEAKAVKETITVTVTAPKGDVTIGPEATAEPDATPAPEATPELETISFPINFTMLKSDAGTRAAFDMEITPPDDQGSMTINFDGTFDAPGKDGGTSSAGTLALKCSGNKDASCDFDLAVKFDKAVGADNLPRFDLTIGGTAGGQKLDLNAGYEGKTATESEQTGTVTLSYDIPEAGKGTISFDTKLETSALKPLGEADFAGKTKIDPLNASPEEMTQMETEMQGVMMQAMGVLMQTPGLSNIMSGLMGPTAAGSTGSAG